jgi:hypothetical protein
VKQSELDALVARRALRANRFFRMLWFVILPGLGLVLYFGVFSHDQPRHVDPPQVPTYNCASAAASLANIDPGGQIAPLCGATPYPDQGQGG